MDSKHPHIIREATQRLGPLYRSSVRKVENPERKAHELKKSIDTGINSITFTAWVMWSHETFAEIIAYSK